MPVARSFLQELYAVISAVVLPFKTHLCAQAVWLKRVKNMAVSGVRVILIKLQAFFCDLPTIMLKVWLLNDIWVGSVLHQLAFCGMICS